MRWHCLEEVLLLTNADGPGAACSLLLQDSRQMTGAGDQIRLGAVFCGSSELWRQLVSDTSPQAARASQKRSCHQSLQHRQELESPNRAHAEAKIKLQMYIHRIAAANIRAQCISSASARSECSRICSSHCIGSARRVPTRLPTLTRNTC